MPLTARLDGLSSRSQRDSSVVDHNSFVVAAMSKETGLSSHDELSSGSGKRTFGQKFKRSCVRFWWIYLFVFIALVLVIVLPM
jgi:hypothetical protein